MYNGVYRKSSHADIDLPVNQASLGELDPKQQDQLIGKAKRVRAVLYAAMDSNPAAARPPMGRLPTATFRRTK